MIALRILAIVILVPAMLTGTEACLRKFVGRSLTASIQGSTRSVAQSTVQQVTNQAVSQVATQVGNEAAKKSFTEMSKWLGKKAAGLGGQAVVFGAVDAAGDAMRNAATGGEVTNQVLAIQDKAKELKALEISHDEKKMQHDKEMKQLALQEKRLVPVMKPTVIIEEITNDDVQQDQQKPQQASSSQFVNTGTLPSTSTDYSEWIKALAYAGGSFAAFLVIFLAYSCCRLHGRGENGEGKRHHRRRPCITNNATVAVICLLGLVLAAAGDSRKPASMYVRHVILRERIPVPGSDAIYGVVVATVTFPHTPQDLRDITPMAKQQLTEIQKRQFELAKPLLFRKFNEDNVNENTMIRFMKTLADNKFCSSKALNVLKAFFSNIVTYYKEYIGLKVMLAVAFGFGFVVFLKFRTAQV